MVIVIDNRFPAARPGGFELYTEMLLRELALQQPEYRFVVLTIREESSNTVENIARIVTGVFPSGLKRWWWQRVGLPRLLRQQKATIYISCNGLLSHKNQLPQLFFSSGPGWEEEPDRVGDHRLLIPPGRWMTVTGFGRDQWAAQNPALREGKIAGIAVRPFFKPIDWEEKTLVKEQYAGGTEYFLCTGAFLPRKNLVTLLKAFSLFKKRQQSNLKLVLAGVAAENYTAFEKALSTYKYRADVVLTGYLDGPELARVTAAAYGMVYPSLYEEVATPVAEALQAGVPVVATTGTAAAEIAGDAALYADPETPVAIADQLMRLYKDERLRTQLIRAGLEKASAFSIAEAARRLTAMIEALPRN